MKMAKYDRLLFILNLLRSRRNLNAGMIACECGVTERTIYRDIIALSEANIPIYYDNGYKYASDNFLPPLNFNIDEYLTLKTALESSPLYKGGHSRQIIKSIKNKIEACLSPAVKKEKRYSGEATDVNIKATHSKNFSEKFYATVEHGIKRQLLLNLEYNSIQSGIAQRQVEPYFLIFIERAFYFVGFCRLRGALRTFRIDRIINVTATETHFKARANINPTEYFKNSWGVYGGETEEIELTFSGSAARVIQLGQHHPSEKVNILKNGLVEYKVTVSGDEEICRWILGFGGEATVIRPLKLARKIQRIADEIRKNYK
jgi:predicted DNA-binding transcriptional regulator YafY